MTDQIALHYRPLGTSDLQVSPVSFGCWPIAGISSLEVNDRDSLATLHAACDAGINFFDTAYSYGYDGEADRLLAQVLRERDERLIVASKVGSHYRPDRTRCVDGRPETLLRHAEEIVHRLGVEAVDILYLHEPDPQVPITESADAIAEIIRRGWARYAGVSNVSLQQLAAFHQTCPVVVVQPPFNMLQSQSLDAIRDYCLEQQIGVACYWVLMKGLLAGKLMRDHQFDPRDRRLTYPIYQGAAWERAQDLLDALRGIAAERDCTVSQLVIAWTLQQPAVTVAICGAKRSEQITETALAMQIQLSAAELQQINELIRHVGRTAN
jgi:aryl-alcohol dehydrogenase-like predicted oxidoreductase